MNVPDAEISFRRWAQQQLARREPGDTDATVLHRAMTAAPSPDYPGKLWELLLENADKRHASGSWFTPEELAEYLADRAVAALPAGLKRPRVLDPACGAGVFLAAVAARCAEACLCGVDRQPEALALTQYRLNGRAADLTAADALRMAWRAEFDLVIGNPPYLALPELPAEERRNARANFTTARGRFNTWGLFLELTVRALRPGGIGALVLPDRLWRNVQDAGLRQWLGAETELLEIVHLDFGGFRAAVVHTDLVLFRRAPGRPDGLVWERRVADLATLRTADAGHWVAVSALSQPTGGLFARLAALSLPFGAIADIRDGIIQSRVGAELFAPTESRSTDRPLLFGRDIQPGRIHDAGRRIDYRPEWMAALERARQGRGLRLRSPAIFERPKILTRQTADTLIAAYDRAGRYYYGNTLHGSHLTDNNFDPEFVTFYLNSPVGRYAYRQLSCEAGRPFAQVKIARLREVPIPRLALEVQKKIAATGDVELLFLSLKQCGKWSKSEISELDDLKYS